MFNEVGGEADGICEETVAELFAKLCLMKWVAKRTVFVKKL